MPTLVPGVPRSSRMTPHELKSRLTTPVIQLTRSYMLLLVKAFLWASATQWGEFGDWNKRSQRGPLCRSVGKTLCSQFKSDDRGLGKYRVLSGEYPNPVGFLFLPGD